MVQYENNEVVLYNGAGFDTKIDDKTALPARIIESFSVYKIELLGDRNKEGKFMRIIDSSDSRVLKKGPARTNKERSLAKGMHSNVKSAWDFEVEASSFELLGHSSSDCIRVVKPVIKLGNENGELRLWVGNTYAISTNQPKKLKNSYDFQGHQVHQGSSGKYEADKKEMLRVNFGSQESAAKFYDTYAEIAGFDGKTKANEHDSSASQRKEISPPNNLQSSPPEILRDEDPPIVNHDGEDMKSPVFSAGSANDKYRNRPTVEEKIGHNREDFLSSLSTDRSSMSDFKASKKKVRSEVRSSENIILLRPTRSDPHPQTDEKWVNDKSTKRSFVFAEVSRPKTAKNVKVNSRKQKDDSIAKILGRRKKHRTRLPHGKKLSEFVSETPIIDDELSIRSSISDITASKRNAIKARSSTNIFGTPSSYTDSYIDKNSLTADKWLIDKSRKRKGTYSFSVTSKKEKDYNSNAKIDNRTVLESKDNQELVTDAHS